MIIAIILIGLFVALAKVDMNSVCDKWELSLIRQGK